MSIVLRGRGAAGLDGAVSNEIHSNYSFLHFPSLLGEVGRFTMTT